MIHLQYPVLLILGCVAALTAWGRLRTDVVAVLALTAALLGGVLPLDQAFSGLGSPVVAIIALLAIISAAIRNSVLVETMLGGLAPLMRWQTGRVAVLGLVGAVISVGLGSGAVLSSVMTAAVQGIRRDRQQLLPILLPISLLAIMGGLASAVGTLPNLLAWSMQPGIAPFGTAPFGIAPFGFAPTGVPVALAGLLLVVAAWRLLPRAADPEAGPGPLQIESYTSEVLVPAGSPLVGQSIGAIERRSEGTVTLKGIVREDFRRIEPRADWTVEAGDVLVLACAPTVLQRMMERSGLQIVGGVRGDVDPERVGVVEAIVTPASDLVGRSMGQGGQRGGLGGGQRGGLGGRDVSLLAIGRSGRQPPGRLHRTKLQAGDVLMLQGELATMPATLAGMGCLTLAERRLRLGRRRRLYTPALVLIAALALAAAGTLTLPVALLAAALVLVLGRAVTPDEIYAAIPWPVLVMVGALLPISLACRDGGAADAVVRLLAPVLANVPDLVVPPALMVLAMAMAPLFTGAVTLLLLSPFVLALASQSGLRPDALLVAAALGASCEFLTLAGRQAAALVPGPERRWTVWRLLLPLYATVLVVGAGALVLHWPDPRNAPPGAAWQEMGR